MRDGAPANQSCAASGDLSHPHATSPEMLHFKPHTVLSIPRQVSWTCRSRDCASHAVRVGLPNMDALHSFLSRQASAPLGAAQHGCVALGSQAWRSMVMQCFEHHCASCAFDLQHGGWVWTEVLLCVWAGLSRHVLGDFNHPRSAEGAITFEFPMGGP